MPYSVDVSVIDLVGGAFSPASCRLWEAWNEVGGAASVDRQEEYDRIDIANPTTSTFTVSFPVRGPSIDHAPHHDIGLSIQDLSRVNEGAGWWFRSGRLQGLPSQAIEVILAAPETIPAASLTSDLMLPITEGSETIAGVTLAPGTPAGAIGFTATGTTTRVPGATLAFTYTSTLTLSPSGTMFDPARNLVDAGLAQGTLSFTAGTGQGFITAILNAVSGLVEKRIRPRIREIVDSRINNSAIDQIAMRLLPAPPPNPDGSPGPRPVLPPSVIPSVRTVSVSSTGVTVRAALAAYGGVLSALRPSTPGSTPRPICPTSMLAMAGLLSPVHLAALRAWRDGLLVRDPSAAAAAAAYRRHSTEVSRILLKHPKLALDAARAAREAAETLPGPITPQAEAACERVLGALGKRGSCELRSDIASALIVRPWRVVTT